MGSAVKDISCLGDWQINTHTSVCAGIGKSVALSCSRCSTFKVCCRATMDCIILPIASGQHHAYIYLCKQAMVMRGKCHRRSRDQEFMGPLVQDQFILQQFGKFLALSRVDPGWTVEQQDLQSACFYRTRPYRIVMVTIYWTYVCVHPRVFHMGCKQT